MMPTPRRFDTAVGPNLIPPLSDHFRSLSNPKGLCENCGVVQCYEIKKRIVGLFPGKKVPLTKTGKVYNGICLDCNPDRDPDRSVATRKHSNSNFGGDAGAGGSHRLVWNEEKKIEEQAADIPNHGISHSHSSNRDNNTRTPSREEKVDEQAADTPNYDTSQLHSSSNESVGNINNPSWNEEKVEEQVAEEFSFSNTTYSPSTNRGIEGNGNPQIRDSSAQSNSSLDTDEPLDALTKLLRGFMEQNPNEHVARFDPENPNAVIHVQDEVVLVDDQSVLTLGSGLDTIVTRQKSQKSNLMPISESHVSERGLAPHVAAFPAQVTELRQLVDLCADDSAIEIIREELMRDNCESKNIDLALYCLNTLWSLARKSDSNKRLIIAGNKPSTYDAILEAMHMYVKSADLQARGCGLIFSLSMEPNNRTHVANFGGCDAILEAMNWHQEDESLQAMAIRALKVLSFDPDGRNVLCSWGAPISVADAMHMHINNPSIQSEGSNILGNLARKEESQTVSTVSEREIDAIIRGMLEHPDSLAVHEAACSTLMSLASLAANASLIRRHNKSNAALEVAMENHSFSVRTAVSILLQRLNSDLADATEREDRKNEGL